MAFRLCRYRHNPGGGIIQVIGGALSVRGRGEDGAGILLHDFEPVGDIGGVFLARFLVQVKVGADKGAAQFGDQFLGGIAGVAP